MSAEDSGNHHVMPGGSWGITGGQGAATLGGAVPPGRGSNPSMRQSEKPGLFATVS